MTHSQRNALAWRLGRWLLSLDLSPIEQRFDMAPTPDGTSIDWDVLASQYGVPVASDADGLQLCARCGQSVEPRSYRFTGRVRLGSFIVRIAQGHPFPAGAYLCGDCDDKIIDCMPDDATPV